MFYLKLLGRLFFGFLVAYIGLNVYALSNFDMQTAYVKKYGNEAVENADQTFFKSLYDYYLDENLVEVSDTYQETVLNDENESEVVTYSYNLYMFYGIAGGRNFIRVQMDDLSGYDYSKGIEVTFYVEGGNAFTLGLYDISDSFMFGAVDLKKLYSPDGETEFYYNILDVKVYALGVDDNGLNTKVKLYDFEGDVFLDKADMQLAEALTTPLDPNADDKVYPTPESLGLTKGVAHNYFNEFQWTLWKNMAMYVVIIAFLTYLLFFRKKKSYGTTKGSPVRFKENLNSKVIEEKDEDLPQQK